MNQKEEKLIKHLEGRKNHPFFLNNPCVSHKVSFSNDFEPHNVSGAALRYNSSLKVKVLLVNHFLIPLFRTHREGGRTQGNGGKLVSVQKCVASNASLMSFKVGTRRAPGLHLSFNASIRLPLAILNSP